MKALNDKGTVILTMTVSEARTISNAILKVERELAEAIETRMKEGFSTTNSEARRKILDEAFFALLDHTS